MTITGRKPDELPAAAEGAGGGPRGRGAGRVLAVAGQRRVGRVPRGGRSRAPSRRSGGWTILVNNTGINPIYGPLVDADLDGVRKIFEINVVAALGFVQLAHRAWMGEHGGAIVNLASVGGLRSTGRDRRATARPRRR